MLIQTTEMFFFEVRIGLWIQPESRTRVRAIAHMSRSWETTGATLVKASLAVTLVRCRSSCVNTCSPFGWQGTQLVRHLQRDATHDTLIVGGCLLHWWTHLHFTLINMDSDAQRIIFYLITFLWLNKEVVAFVIDLIQFFSKLTSRSGNQQVQNSREQRQKPIESNLELNTHIKITAHLTLKFKKRWP